MTARRRWAASHLILILAIAFALVASACGSTAPATPRPSAGAGRSTAPILTPVPGQGSPAATATLPTTTGTEFGAIWDALPSSFPKLPGQQPAEIGAGATSGSFAVNGDAATASQAMATALRAQGWTVDLGSPLEDGTVVVEATGTNEGCAAEVRFTPMSGTVVMSVLYGAECPFG